MLIPDLKRPHYKSSLLLFFFSHSWEMAVTPGLPQRPSGALSGQRAQIRPCTLFPQRPTRHRWPTWSAAPPRRHRPPPRWVAPTTRGACGGRPWADAAPSPGRAPLTTAIKQHVTALNRGASWIRRSLYAKWNYFIIRESQQKAMLPEV